MKFTLSLSIVPQLAAIAENDACIRACAAHECDSEYTTTRIEVDHPLEAGSALVSSLLRPVKLAERARGFLVKSLATTTAQITDLGSENGFAVVFKATVKPVANKRDPSAWVEVHRCYEVVVQ